MTLLKTEKCKNIQTQELKTQEKENCYDAFLFCDVEEERKTRKTLCQDIYFDDYFEQKQMIKTDLWANEFIAATW